MEELELEPLFDYTSVQPINPFSVDDDDDVDPFPFPGKKRRRSSDPEQDDKENDPLDDKSGGDKVNNKENNEEDWMPPLPPVVSNSRLPVEEDRILQELRLRKQELAFTQTADDILKGAVESVKRKYASSEKPSVIDLVQPSKPERRQKIFISIQDQEGEKKFCMYMDDKLERLFKMYADKSQMKLDSLIFCFDGDKVNPDATPEGLGLEDHDIIEARHKKPN